MMSDSEKLYELIRQLKAHAEPIGGGMQRVEITDELMAIFESWLPQLKETGDE